MSSSQSKNSDKNDTHINAAPNLYSLASDLNLLDSDSDENANRNANDLIEDWNHENSSSNDSSRKELSDDTENTPSSSFYSVGSSTASQILRNARPNHASAPASLNREEHDHGESERDIHDTSIESQESSNVSDYFNSDTPPASRHISKETNSILSKLSRIMSTIDEDGNTDTHKRSHLVPLEKRYLSNKGSLFSSIDRTSSQNESSNEEDHNIHRFGRRIVAHHKVKDDMGSVRNTPSPKHDVMQPSESQITPASLLDEERAEDYGSKYGDETGSSTDVRIVAGRFNQQTPSPLTEDGLFHDENSDDAHSEDPESNIVRKGGRRYGNALFEEDSKLKPFKVAPNTLSPLPNFEDLEDGTPTTRKIPLQMKNFQRPKCKTPNIQSNKRMSNDFGSSSSSEKTEKVKNISTFYRRTDEGRFVRMTPSEVSSVSDSHFSDSHLSDSYLSDTRYDKGKRSEMEYSNAEKSTDRNIKTGGRKRESERNLPSSSDAVICINNPQPSELSSISDSHAPNSYLSKMKHVKDTMSGNAISSSVKGIGGHIERVGRKREHVRSHPSSNDSVIDTNEPTLTPQMSKKLRYAFIGGWIAILALVALSVGFGVTRRNNKNKLGESSIESTQVGGEVTFSPSAFVERNEPLGNVDGDQRLSLSPSVAPSNLRSMLPTLLPTNEKTIAPSAFPTKFITPTNSPTVKEATRIEEITELLTSISGAPAFSDITSPQYAALEWISISDPARLSATDSYSLIQRYSIATLYFAGSASTSVSGWKNCGRDSLLCDTESERFLSGGDVCDWYGITCTAGFVTNIDLKENRLEGVLPGLELSQLTNLRTVNLSKNKLFSTIPTEIGLLPELTRLALSRNDLTGSVPTELGLLTQLDYLVIDYNALEGNLTSVAPIFIPSLRSLSLSNNKLTGTIPDELFLNSPSMVNLDLSRNSLTGTIPTGMGRLVRLEWLAMQSNEFEGNLPGEIFNSNNIKKIDVNTNSLVGPLPDEMYSAASLTSLDLGNNKFSSTISNEISNLLSLKELFLWFNQLTGIIPTSMGDLENLESLQLGYNSLRGDMPSEVCRLRSLQLKSLSADCYNQRLVSCLKPSCCSSCF